MAVITGEAMKPTAYGRRRVLQPWALVAAAMLHLLPLLFLLWHWQGPPPQHPRVFKVRLVLASPPEPKAKTLPAPVARESGPDQITEAKKAKKQTPALPPVRTEPRHEESRRAAVLTPKPAVEGMRTLELRLPPKGGDAKRNRAGDPYLNGLMRRIESNRVYPPVSAFNGARERTVIYSVGVDPVGSVSTITLLASSGQSLIDEAARQMIAASAPFPHLPADLPQIRTSIIIFIPVYPRG